HVARSQRMRSLGIAEDEGAETRASPETAREDTMRFPPKSINRGAACPKSGTFGLKPCYGATYRARSTRPFHPARRASFHVYRLVTHGCHRPSRTFRPHATDKPAHRHGLPYLSPRRAAARGAARPRDPLRRRSRPLGGPAAAKPPGPPRRG